MGKGDTYRPVDKKKFDENYDAIFGEKFDLTIDRTDGSWSINIDNDGQKIELSLDMFETAHRQVAEGNKKWEEDWIKDCDKLGYTQ